MVGWDGVGCVGWESGNFPVTYCLVSVACQASGPGVKRHFPFSNICFLLSNTHLHWRIHQQIKQQIAELIMALQDSASGGLVDTRRLLMSLASARWGARAGDVGITYSRQVRSGVGG